MATFTNLKGERISSVKNKDGTTTKTVLSTGNPVTATHSGSKDKDGNNTVDAYNKSIGYSASGKVKTGITTSKDAENRGKAANETLKGITTPSADVENPLTALYSRLDKLKADVATAKEKVAASKATKTADTTTATQTGATDTTTPATPEAADPILQFMQDSSTKYLDILGQQAQTLGQYREQHNEYTQQEIDSIARTAERAVKNQVAENQRTVDAMRFAGVVAGRAQFAPTVEQSIIHEVIQDGLDEIEVINEKKNSAIRAARQAESEFNIEAFEQQSELAKEYHKEVEGAFSRMNAHVRQVELDEREKTKFRQEQADRDAFILAPELMNSTPEQIMQAAVANGIDPGLLAREVQAYKDEQAMNDLDIQSKKESILSSQSSRANDAARLNLDYARFNREGQKTTEEEKPLSLAEISSATSLYGLENVGEDGKVKSTLIPSHWTASDLAQFNSLYGADMQTVGNMDEKREILKKFNAVIDAAGSGAEKGLQGEELNTYVANQVAASRKPISEVKQEATNLLKENLDIFHRAAQEAGHDALGFSKGRDVTAWLSSPNTQNEIEELAKTMSPTQIVNEIKKRYGSS